MVVPQANSISRRRLRGDLITARKYLHREEISDSRQLLNQPADDYIMKTKSQKPKGGKFGPEMQSKCSDNGGISLWKRLPQDALGFWLLGASNQTTYPSKHWVGFTSPLSLC